jgi:SAM-dependent methyltransferase
MAIYDRIGQGYSAYRRPDPRIARLIDQALGDADSVVNVGAGSGSYEPQTRQVIAVEPSEVMRRQRPPGAAPCLPGQAEALPLDDDACDAAMAVLTMHHWSDPAAGLREMARVARKRLVLLTWVPDGPPFWLTRDYFPEIVARDRTIFPSTPDLLSLIEANVARAQASPVPIPHDCTDGFLASYWRRPEAYLDSAARSAISSFAQFDAATGLARLQADLETGGWAARNAELLDLDEADFGYRLIRCELAAARQRQASGQDPTLDDVRT